MRHYRIIIISFLTTILYLGCADQITSEADLKRNNTTESLSKFSKIQSDLFNTSCAKSGCHGSDNTQAELNLTSGNAYNNIVNVTSVLEPSRKRVMPGNANESVLYRVLSYNFPTKMPPEGKLDQNIIDSIVVWINKGAPND